MRARMARLSVLLIPLLTAGCVHHQLELTTLRTLNTLPDLTYQQVIDNLAAIAANPGRLPSLAVVGQGSVQVTGNGGLTLGGTKLSVIPSFTTALNTTGTLSLGTVTSPEKLREMRAVYQRAVSLKVQQHPSYQWLQFGHYRTVPADAAHTGRHGDLAVWVMPDGVAGLSELTLEILDIATREDRPMGVTGSASATHYRRNFQVPATGPVFTPGG
jgi:hypothetical protein